MCDYILIISKGKLVASDTPDRLEEKMSGTETVEILAKASAAEVRAILLNVEHISNIHTQERADKTCSARIQTEGGCDIREALSLRLQKMMSSVGVADFKDKPGRSIFGTDTKRCSRRGGTDKCWQFINEN